MYIEHNSYEQFFRNPFGATPVETKIKLRLSVSGIGIPHYVKCKISSTKGLELEQNMMFELELSGSSIYYCEINTPSIPCLLHYYFEVKNDEGIFYYGNNDKALGGKGQVYDSAPNNKYQITVFSKDYSTPDWFKKTVVYQIFPDRFASGTEDGSFLSDRCDIIKRSWGDTPFYKAEQFGGTYLANDFFGGNLLGIEKKLPYLKELGIGTIYLNPIFRAYSNHKYDTGNYEEIDPMFGTEEDFTRLCEKAKKLDIRIVLDGVFNHTGSNSKYFNKDGEYDSIGAYQGEESPYYNWYTFKDSKDDYECWWGIKTLPHVDEKCDSFRDYILRGENAIIKKWLKCGASGWRLDVVDELPDFFVKELRENAKEVKSDAVIIGEVWEDASNKISYDEQREYFYGDELDSVMNYPLRNAIIEAVLQRIDADELANRIMSLKENYPKESFLACLNMLSSHDVERILSVLGANSRPENKDEMTVFRLSECELEAGKKRVLLATALQMTLPGVPSIFYGDEIGTEGFIDPFCRACFDWSKIENNSFLDEFKDLIKLRNNEEALQTGDFSVVYKIGSVFGFVREKALEKIVVLANFSDNNERIRLDVGRFNISRMVNIVSKEEINSEDGIYWLDVPQKKALIFKTK